MFLTSPWIPAEWIRAHGLQPRGIWSAENFQPGALPLSAGVCAFAEAAVRFAEAQTDSAVIFSTACDQMRRGFDAAILRGQRRAFLFNLPATWQTAAAGQIFRSELERLGQFLLAIGGRAPSPEGLRQEMVQSGGTRKRLLESAASQFSARVCRSRGAISLGRRFFAAAAGRAGKSNSARPGRRAVSRAALEIAGRNRSRRRTRRAERHRNRRTQPVVRHLNLRPDAIHPFDALVHGYCDNIVDVFQRPNTRLYSWLKPRLASRRVRGIVLWHFTGCDLWRAEAQTLRETFGLPVLLLEAGGEPGAAPRELNRLQAFVETLG